MLIAAISDEQWVGLGIAAVAFVLFFAVVAKSASTRRRARGTPDIPAAMQPGPSDADRGDEDAERA